MKQALITLMIVCTISTISFAQPSGEFEVGSDGLGEIFVSEYVYYDFTSVNMLARYFIVSNVLGRAEFAIGPTLSINDNIVKLQFGGSTDGEVMMACVVITNKWNGMLYIADAKISANASILRKYISIPPQVVNLHS